ncbi:hypothetical protein BH11ACT2_BH11ACT2_23610 [soil metagenome]
MAHWAPLKQDTLDSLAAEISHNYGSGFALVAIAAESADAAASFATELAASFGARSTSVVALDSPPLPSRAEHPDTLFLVTGAVTSHAQSFNYTVWLETDRIDRTSRAAASAIVDITDPEHPRRVFADSC